MKKQTLLLIVFLFLCQLQLSAKPDGNINDKYYRKAFSQILSMLEGQEVESFKNAVFHVENAYFDGKLSYSNYNYKVHQLVQLSRLVANQNSLDYPYSDSTNIKINYGVTSVLMDSIKIRFNNEEIKLSPSRYDFEDITGESDWTKMFVSKLLYEGTGNCHSLPYLYKILVEAAGGTTHLALAPHHIYIKTPSANNKIGWYNTELTNHSHPNDGWIIASGYISLEAIQNGLYMQPLDHKASLALCLLDLAQGYIKKFPHVKNDFVITCINTALNYYPNCVNGLLLKAEYLYKESGISEDLNTICQQLIRLGYDQMPQSMYLDWLTRSESTVDSMDKFQEFNNELGNPFGNVDKAPTLSKGRYAEFHELEVQEMIGSLIFNTNTQEVVGEKQEAIIQPTIVSRFLSVDPLAPEYPWYTPYQFAGNMPIAAIDLDGLEPLTMIDAQGKLTEPVITLLTSAFGGLGSDWNRQLLEKSNWVEDESINSEALALVSAWYPNTVFHIPARLLILDNITNDDRPEARAIVAGTWLELIAHEETHRIQVNQFGVLGMGAFGVIHDSWVGYKDKWIEEQAFMYGDPGGNSTSLTSELLKFGGTELIELLDNPNIDIEERTRRAEIIGLEFRLPLIDEKIAEFDEEINNYIRENKNIEGLNNVKKEYINEATRIEQRLNELRSE